MSLAEDSPVVHSSGSDDLAATLDAVWDNASDGNDGDRVDYSLDLEWVRRQRVELCPAIINPQSSSFQGNLSEILGPLPGEEFCAHPGSFRGMCIKCGLLVDDGSAVPLKYIDKNLRVSNEEMARLRYKDHKDLICNRRKLYLFLDLDHTLLNSVPLINMTKEEAYLNSHGDTLPDSLKNSLFNVDKMRMMTKLRPFVHTFLEEASRLFVMYIYTLGKRPYALEMAKLLDPSGKYFHSRIIAQGDGTQKYHKNLDIVMGHESDALILDDTESVWKENKDNLILIERYHFFASSCKSFGINQRSLSQLRIDESETDGALATVLKILQRIHSLIFDKGRIDDQADNLEYQDVRQVLKTVRMEVLKDCKIVFNGVMPANIIPEQHRFWGMAEQLGATCSMEVDPSVTHVVSLDAGTDATLLAIMLNKFLVTPEWLEACYYSWRKQPEEKYPVRPLQASLLTYSASHNNVGSRYIQNN